MNSNKLTELLPLLIDELNRNPINNAEVVVAYADFFLIPKYKGFRLTPVIIIGLIE